MSLQIGCSAALAFGAFIIGFAVSLFVREATWTDQLTMATMPAVITFVVVFLLARRDTAVHSTVMRSVRDDLLRRDDTSDDRFLSSGPADDVALLLETRKAISRFFDVPPGRINRDFHLIEDLRVDRLEPSFQFYVVESVMASRQMKPGSFVFSMAGLTTIDDLTRAIREVLECKQKSTDRTEDQSDGLDGSGK